MLVRQLINKTTQSGISFGYQSKPRSHHKSGLLSVFMARCYAECGYATVGCLSVCPSGRP